MTSVGTRLSWLRRQATRFQRPLPDFLIIGAAKSATTSLYEYLVSHPQVCPPVRKEVCYFAFYSDRSVGWYRACFPTRRERARAARAAGAPTLTGEACAYYLFHPHAPARAAAVVPHAKLIVLLRDPVDRAISHYHFRVDRNHEDRSMEEAFADDIGHSDADFADADYDHAGSFAHFRTYVRRGQYAEQLRRWRAAFPVEQMLVIETSQLTRTGGDGFDRVLEFLDLQPWRPPTFDEHLQARYAPAEAEIREVLARHYAPHNAELREMLGVDWQWTEPDNTTKRTADGP